MISIPFLFLIFPVQTREESTPSPDAQSYRRRFDNDDDLTNNNNKMCLAALDTPVVESRLNLSTLSTPTPPPPPHLPSSSSHGSSTADSGALDISPPAASVTHRDHGVSGGVGGGVGIGGGSYLRRSRRNLRRRKKRNLESTSAGRFEEVYEWTEDLLGAGSYGSVRTCFAKAAPRREFAVKIVEKKLGHSRGRMFNEIEMYHVAQGLNNIVQLVQYFEEDSRFLMVFEKMNGGSLADQLARHGRMSEALAKRIVEDVATPLAFLHARGIAHRDLKLDNILSGSVDEVLPVKICDFDLASGLKEAREARDRLGAVSTRPGNEEIFLFRYFFLSALWSKTAKNTD